MLQNRPFRVAQLNSAESLGLGLREAWFWDSWPCSSVHASAASGNDRPLDTGSDDRGHAVVPAAILRAVPGFQPNISAFRLSDIDLATYPSTLLSSPGM